MLYDYLDLDLDQLQKHDSRSETHLLGGRCRWKEISLPVHSGPRHLETNCVRHIPELFGNWPQDLDGRWWLGPMLIPRWPEK